MASTYYLKQLVPLIVVASFLIVNYWLIFIWVPTEINQGLVQKIFYLHIPVAWVSMVAIVVTAIFSFLYLWKRNEKYDQIAYSTAQTGLLFGLMMLVTGMIWAYPVWGTWWTGEAKLTTALILFLIYVAYILFRNFYPPGGKRNRIAAVIALLGAIDTPIIYYAADIWQQNHPPAVIAPTSESAGIASSEIYIVLFFSVITMTLLFTLITSFTYRIQKANNLLEFVKSQKFYANYNN